MRGWYLAFAFVAGLAFWGAAVSAETVVPPCTHSEAGATPTDALRCQVAVDDQRIVELDRQLRALQADNVMTHNDLSASQQKAAQREKDLGAWFHGWFDQ